MRSLWLSGGLYLLALMLLPLIMQAAPPAWWSGGAVDPSKAPNDYAVVNQGQLRFFAEQAAAEMDAHLPGGAGDVIHQQIIGWHDSTSTTTDYAAVNLGMLKAVAALFYDQLKRVDYTNGYPWDGHQAQANDYAAANIGQVKQLFAFDLTAATPTNDLDGDGIADWWEKYYFPTAYANHALAPSALASRGDGLTILQAFQQGLNPNDYFNGVLTVISIASGNNQSAGPNAWVADPLVVSVTDGATNAAKVNAPIVFASPTAQIATSPSGVGSSSVEVRSNSQGKATIYLKLPASGVFHQVTASANNVVSVIFYAGLAQLAPSPANISLSVDQGEVQERMLTLVNSTNQSISYVLDPSSISIPWAPTEMPQDANNPEYNWTDSAAADGPAYVWNDISTTGTLLNDFQKGGIPNSDDGYQQISLLFSFPFFGNSFASAWISTNGYLTFGAGSTLYDSFQLPGTDMAPNLIAPLYKDLDLSNSGHVYYKADATKLTVQFDGVPPYSDSGSYTYQMVLESSGVITFYYKTITGAVSNATVGIQNSDAATLHGRQVAYDNQTYPHDGLAVQFHFVPIPPPPWLQLKNYVGKVAAGQSANVDVTLSSIGLSAGTYTATLHLKDNSGNMVGPDVPITWTVSGNVVVDTDGDGLPDGWETQHFGDLSQGANDDPDHDGLSNLIEYRLGSDPLNPDTNGDGIIDGVAYGLGISVTNLDMDGDGVSNAVERQRGTDPFVFSFPTSQNTTKTFNDHVAPIITLSVPAGAVLH